MLTIKEPLSVATIQVRIFLTFSVNPIYRSLTLYQVRISRGTVRAAAVLNTMKVRPGYGIQLQNSCGKLSTWSLFAVQIL